MKKHVIIACAAIALISGSSFRLLTDCSTFEQFTKGATFTTTNYNSDSKPQSSVEGTVREVTATGDKTIANVDVIMKDGTGKETGTATYDLTCSGGSYMMDMKAFATQQAAHSGAKDMTMSIEGDMMEYPAGMTAGQVLPNGSVTMTMSKDNSVVSTTTIIIKDRKCEKVESKTTPAGTWECYKITYTVDGTMKMGTISMPIPARTATEWFSFKVGSVRTESYKKGKLESYSELTAFKKPTQ
ncbi:MAG TPA: hypothetical protein VK826_18300 [Bacteroidia bacterium]|nr:hypothetical protein [Bacteroidia bacterium]